MAKFGVLIYKSNQKKDGSFPVCLRITKDGKRKYIDLGLTAKEDQWNEETARFKKDKRVNPNHEKYNTLLNWKSHATLTLLATQDLPTFGYNMIDPLKSWCWGSILLYPFKISRFS